MARLSGGREPIIIMLHGYRYAPGDPVHCPHRTLLSPGGRFSWPDALGIGSPTGGFGIALGWAARCSLRDAHARARAHGGQLARIVAHLKGTAPDRPVHVIAHSLGSEIALSALAHLARGAIDRIVLLTGASHKSHAEAMLATPAGRSVEVLNVTSRENDLFDAAFERFVPSRRVGDCAIGHGIAAPNALTLQLDCPRSLEALQRLGIGIAPPLGRVSHWSAYTRPGAMEFYARLMRRPDSLPLSLLQTALPGDTAARWSRFRPVKLPLARPRLPGALRIASRVARRAQPSPSCSTA
ncbi:alpha/beta hydrolase [Sulfitobacter sp. D35]|uniref:alpha/beta hydrolase n=1 Tax=Sulfitobacter sp. D35 TaxID=3083252 RepID=UPI00296EA34B|nr:alpha/beta hydrolase [Sulfitobacter sp. D35]MDW4499863.1 alpha/beta hydrolase [Sulfitobacter sp. D35]